MLNTIANGLLTFLKNDSNDKNIEDEIRLSLTSPILDIKLLEGFNHEQFLPNNTISFFNDSLQSNYSLHQISNGIQEVSYEYAALLLILIPLMTVFGNCLVLLSVAQEKNLQSITNYFIVSLACADILVSTLVMPFAVYVEFTKGVWKLGEMVCDFFIACDVFMSTASILNLTAISVDRFIAVTQPIKYSKQNHSIRVPITIGLCWLVSAAIACPILLGLNYTPDRDSTICIFYNADFILYSSLSSFYIPCIIMAYLYTKIFAVLGKRAKLARHKFSPGLKTTKTSKLNNNALNTCYPNPPDISMTQDCVNSENMGNTLKNKNYVTTQTIPIIPVGDFICTPLEAKYNPYQCTSNQGSIIESPSHKSSFAQSTSLALTTNFICKRPKIDMYINKASFNNADTNDENDSSSSIRSGDLQSSRCYKLSKISEQHQPSNTILSLKDILLKVFNLQFGQKPPNPIRKGDSYVINGDTIPNVFNTNSSQSYFNLAHYLQGYRKGKKASKQAKLNTNNCLIGEKLYGYNTNAESNCRNSIVPELLKKQSSQHTNDPIPFKESSQLTLAISKDFEISPIRQREIIITTAGETIEMSDEKFPESTNSIIINHDTCDINRNNNNNNNYTGYNDTVINSTEETVPSVIKNVITQAKNSNCRKWSNPQLVKIPYRGFGSMLFFKKDMTETNTASPKNIPNSMTSKASLPSLQNLSEIEPKDRKSRLYRHCSEDSYNMSEGGLQKRKLNTYKHPIISSDKKTPPSQPTDDTLKHFRCSMRGGSRKTFADIGPISFGEMTNSVVRLMKRKNSHKKKDRIAKKEKKATQTLAIVLIVFLICWVPFFTVNLLNAVCQKLKYEACQPSIFVFTLSTWIGYINSLLNPAIYTIFNPEFRKAFKKLLRCQQNNNNHSFKTTY